MIFTHALAIREYCGISIFAVEGQSAKTAKIRSLCKKKKKHLAVCQDIYKKYYIALIQLFYQKIKSLPHPPIIYIFINVKNKIFDQPHYDDKNIILKGEHAQTQTITMIMPCL